MSNEPTPNSGTIAVDADVRRRIEDYARGARMTPSDVVREAFEEYAAARNGPHAGDEGGPSVLDVLNRAGLIGCVRAAHDAPTDLSTDPRHMEGFGRA